MYMNYRYLQIQGGTNDAWIQWLVSLREGKFDDCLDEFLVDPAEGVRKAAKDRVKQLEQRAR
jgi:hypothetical protein